MVVMGVLRPENITIGSCMGGDSIRFGRLIAGSIFRRTRQLQFPSRFLVEDEIVAGLSQAQFVNLGLRGCRGIRSRNPHNFAVRVLAEDIQAHFHGMHISQPHGMHQFPDFGRMGCI
jgi:hypothetical protein